jgi:hypothetical protein
MKYSIQVRNKTTNTLITTIKRKIWAEAIGNFNPIFCRYQNKHKLVLSDEGDISDPFRREVSYLNSLYIEIDN